MAERSGIPDVESDNILRSLGITDTVAVEKYILAEYGSIDSLQAKAECEHDSKAQVFLAGLYECGMPEFNIEKDLDKAIYWYGTFILTCDTYNTLMRLSCLATLYFQKDSIDFQKRAIELFLKLKAKPGIGDTLAEFNLAEAYRFGIVGVLDRNLKEAFKFYRRAAEEDHTVNVMGLPAQRFRADLKVKALKKLHELYLCGDCPEGEPQTIKAQYYLKKAAELGDPEAQKDLGLMFLIGETGIPKDFDKAKRWLQKAAKNGNEQAQRTLIELGEKNVPVPFEDSDNDDQNTSESTTKQEIDLKEMELKDELLHSFVIQGPQFFDENTFRQYPDSPTAQRYLKAYLLVREGLEKLTRSNFTDPEGITLLARGVLYENSITQPFSPAINIYRDTLKTFILNQQRKNPHFFEGSVFLILKIVPQVLKLSEESCKLDFRKVMALYNLIHLIKKAEPDKPPKEDPYNYEDDYSSWLHVLYYFLGSYCIISECYRDGAVAFQNALRCCPNYYEAKVGLAYALMQMGYQDDSTELNPDEKLLKSFELPESQRIPAGDFLTWTKKLQIETARELFMQYLEEAPECDKKYPNCHYHLAFMCFNQGDFQEYIKWKNKGEDSEEKWLPFLGPVDVGSKKFLSILDNIPESKLLKKEKMFKGMMLKNEKVSSKNKKKCNNKKCKKERDDMKMCPCHKAEYCGSECQKVDWKEHKKICEWIKQKGKSKKVN